MPKKPAPDAAFDEGFQPRLPMHVPSGANELVYSDRTPVWMHVLGLPLPLSGAKRPKVVYLDGNPFNLRKGNLRVNVSEPLRRFLEFYEEPPLGSPGLDMMVGNIPARVRLSADHEQAVAAVVADLEENGTKCRWGLGNYLPALYMRSESAPDTCIYLTKLLSEIDELPEGQQYYLASVRRPWDHAVGSNLVVKTKSPGGRPKKERG